MATSRMFEVFECSICMENMIKHHPRLLNCGHTFCTPCLEKIMKGYNNRITCPKCRINTTPPENTIHSLPQNTDLVKMYQREQELRDSNNPWCQLCGDEKKAEFFCNSCPGGLICESCARKHKILQLLRKHKVSPIKQKTASTKIKHLCENHEQPNSLYCRRCQLALCTSCLFDSIHETHLKQVVNKNAQLMSNIKQKNPRFKLKQNKKHKKQSHIQTDRPKFMRSIKMAYLPRKIVSCGDGTVLVLGGRVLRYIERFNTDGKVVRRYNTIQNHPVHDVCVYNKTLYITPGYGCKDGTIIDLRTSWASRLMLPKDTYYSILVIERSSYYEAQDELLLLEETERGKILRYIPGKQEVQILVSDINFPSKVFRISESRYIVKTGRYGDLAYCIYNYSWERIGTIYAIDLSILCDDTIIWITGDHRIKASRIEEDTKTLLLPHEVTGAACIEYSKSVIWVGFNNKHLIKLYKYDFDIPVTESTATISSNTPVYY